MSSANGASIYGPGTVSDHEFTPVPVESARILAELCKATPGFSQDAALLNGVTFEGNDLPCIPGPIKSTAFTAALHAMAGIVGHEILHLRGVATNKHTAINTDAVGLFFGSAALPSVDGLSGRDIVKAKNINKTTKLDFDNALLLRASGIYPTRTPNVWFQVHGSTDSVPVLKVLGIDPDQPDITGEAAYEVIKEKTLQLSAADLELLMMDKGLCGAIVHTPVSWLNTQTGAALARQPLVNNRKVALSASIEAPSFPPLSPNDQRPLAGVKVLELARIIAAPAAGAVLSSMGADVIRVQAENKPDFMQGQLHLTAGKRCYALDITVPEQHHQLLELMSEADIVIQGYRLGSLERHGLGLDVALEMAAKRGRSMVWLDENCYGGYEGYYATRPGWQQIADACAGSEYIMAKGFHLSEGAGILPSLPISDMSTGVLSAVNALMMLRNAIKEGGCWHGISALTKFNMATLEPWVGLYSPEIVWRIQETFQFPMWDGKPHVVELLYMMHESWKKSIPDLLENQDFFHTFEQSVYGKSMRLLGPIVKYADPKSTPRWSSPPEPYCWRKGVPEWNLVA